MQLLHPEIDVVPGQPGQRDPARLAAAGPTGGSAVVRLTNATPQENAYTVRLRCEQPYWQDGWYALSALPATGGAENAPPPGKPDQTGPQGRWVKVYVPRGGARDILIRFSVPRAPEARAGRYAYTIDVETHVSGERTARHRDRVTSLPAVAVVRPFFKWSLDVTPEEKRVGGRRRRGDFEAVVTNEGNDWLYCDLRLPRSKDMLLDSPTRRLAVPPPEPGELLPVQAGETEGRPGTQRTAPLAAVTLLKVFRGHIARQPLSVSALRLDAPGVPPRDTEMIGGSVVAVATTETQQAPPDRALVYVPTIPLKLTDFFTQFAGSIRGMAFGLIGIAAAFIMSVYLYEQIFFQGIKVSPQSLEAQPGKTLRVSGQYLQGCKLYMGTKQDGWTQVEYNLDLFHVNRLTIKAVPREFNHQSVKLKAQRFVEILPFLTTLLPSVESKEAVQVGSEVAAAQPPGVNPVESDPHQVGDRVAVAGHDLGRSGVVLVNNLNARVVSWKPDQVVFTIPASSAAVPGAQLSVVVESKGGAPLPAGSLQIASAKAITVAQGDGGKKQDNGGAGGQDKQQAGGGSGGGGKGKTQSDGHSKPGNGGGVGRDKKQSDGGGPNKKNGSGPLPPPPPPVVSPYQLALYGKVREAQQAAGASLGDPLNKSVKAYALAEINDPGAQAAITEALQTTDKEAHALAMVAQGVFNAKTNAGDTTSAETAFGNAIAEQPGLALAYVAQAGVAANDAKRIKILSQGKGAVQGKDKAAVLYTLSQVDKHKGLDNASAEAYQQAVNANPDVERLPRP